MDDVKGVFSSKAVWGAIVTIAAGALGLGHYSIVAADQADLVDLLAGAASIVGGIVAIVGRIVASKKIVVGAKSAAAVLLAIGLAAVSSVAAPRPATAQVTGITKLAREVALKILAKVLAAPDAQSDLQNALKLANAVTPPDYSGKCWQAMLDLGTNLPAASQKAGLFTLYQEKRNLTLAPPSPWEQAFHVACSPIFTDLSADVVGMASLLGLAIPKLSVGVAAIDTDKLDMTSRIALALAVHYRVDLAEFGIHGTQTAEAARAPHRKIASHRTKAQATQLATAQ